MNKGGDPTEGYQFIDPGLYNIKQIIDSIVLNTSWVEWNINETSGSITLVLKKERKKITVRAGWFTRASDRLVRYGYV